MPLSPAFLQERLQRDERFYRVYDAYTPNFNKTLLTLKFYSKYEGDPYQENADPKFVEEIKKAKYDTPREKYSWPSTENQRYGWFTEPLVQVDKNDELMRFYHPRRGSDFVKHQLKLQEEESKLPKSKFNGIPFKVQ